MRLAGDVPEADRILAEQLAQSERDVDGMDILPPDKKAQSYVCLAHDWYKMGAEEEGARLLARAENAYPSYFKNKIIEHTRQSEGFDFLVKSLTSELILMMISNMETK